MVRVELLRLKNEDDLYSTEISDFSSIIISENEWIGFWVELDFPLSSEAYLWITEYAYPLSFLTRNDNGLWIYTVVIGAFLEDFNFKYVKKNDIKLSLYKLFINQTPGISTVFLEIGEEKPIQRIGNVELAINKISQKELEELFDYLLDKGANYWEPFSKTNVKSKNDYSQIPVFLLLKYLYLHLNEFYKILPLFGIDSMTQLRSRYKFSKYNLNLNLNDESILWLLENPDQLISSNFSVEGAVKIRNKFYDISNIKIKEIYESTDITANKVIHGYLLELLLFLGDLELYVKNKLNDIEQVFSENILNKKSFRLVDIQIKKYYDNQYKKIIRLKNIASKILEYIKETLPVSNVLFEVPKEYSHTTKSHYLVVYKHIYEWYSLKKRVTYGYTTLFSGTRTLDQLYELFCLFYLIDNIKKLGFDHPSFVSVQAAVTSSMVTGHQGIYDFGYCKNRNLQIKLYYECIPNGYETVKKIRRWSLAPDFIIQYKRAEDKKWQMIILDAKYKKLNNIKNFTYNEVIPKYLHGIGRVDGNDPKINGLFLLYPEDENRPEVKIDFYHKNNYTVFGNTPILPSIGIIQVPVGTNKQSKILEVITRLIELTLV